MAFCTKCGTQVDNSATFCNKCGAAIPATQAGSPTPKDSVNPSGAPGLGDMLKDLGNTADTTGEYDLADISQNKTMAVLSYFGILVLIPILAAPNSRYARYHANQGLILTIVLIAYQIASGIVKAILGGIPVVGIIITTILGLANLVFLVLAIIGIMNAVKGIAKDLPVIGKYRILS